MSELNYSPKLSEINKIMNQWKHRKLTPIGRLRIIKSLIIPKLNHLILSIPNPDTNLIKKLENDLYHFLWGCNMHKIKKNTVIQDYKYAGLKTIDYPAFIIALKSSWIKRLINSNAYWVKLLETTLEIEISIVRKRELDFTCDLLKKITNLYYNIYV